MKEKKKIKALKVLMEDDPEDFFPIMKWHSIPKPWSPIRVAQW